MKKFSFALIAAAAFIMASCGNKQKAEEVANDSTETFEEKQIKAGMNAQLDSLTNLWMQIKRREIFDVDPDNKIVISAEEKKVAPDYLYTPDKLKGKLETLSAKYRALVVFSIDQQVGTLYGMNDVWSSAIEKLGAEVNDPVMKLVQDGEIDFDDENHIAVNEKVYKTEEEAGRANHFWETCAAAIVEQTYLLSVNQDKLLAHLTDEDAEKLTFRIILLNDAYENLAEYNPQLMQLLSVLQPLSKLNAITVDQLREQLNESKEEIAQARKSLFEF
ncbi:MAG: hypothetical protein J6T00_04845 [Bacteroidaceae bacterium]|nr:hypothetical protein [Bacteroidaceae bacterium]